MFRLLVIQELKKYLSSYVIWYVIALSSILPLFVIFTSILNPEIFTPQTLAFANLFKGFLAERLSGLSPKEITAFLCMVSSLPLLAIILPGFTTIAAAARSFAGESESKTAEILFSLPVSHTSIFLAKTVSSLILGLVSMGIIVIIGISGSEMYYNSISGNWFGFISFSYLHASLLLGLSTILVSSMVGTILSAKIKNTLAVLYIGGVVPALPVLLVVLLSIYNPQLGILSTIKWLFLASLISFPLLIIFASKLFKSGAML